MVRFFQRFVPDVLKRIDQQLLLNAPFLWATRIHFVLFYGGILCLGILGLSITHEISLNEVPDPDNWALLAAIPLVLSFGIWVFFAAKFQAIKSYGKLNPFHPVRNQFIFGLGVLAVVGIPMLVGNTMVQRVQKIMPTEEFEADMIIVENSYHFLRESLADPNGQSLASLSPGYYYDFEAELWNQDVPQEQKLQYADEVVRVLEKYSSKDYPFSGNDLLMASQHAGTPIYHRGLDDDFLMMSSNIRQLYQIHHQRADIQDKDAWILLMVLGTLLFLASQIFMSTSWQTFMFTLLGGAIWGITMVISNGIMESMGMYSDSYIFALVLLSLGFFLYQGYRRTHTQRSAQWKAIALGIATAMMPFAPILLADILGHVGVPLAQQLMFAGCLGTVVAWNVALRPRFLQLHSQPKEN